MKRNQIKSLCMAICLATTFSCSNNNEQVNIPEQDLTNNEEYVTALKLVQDFSKEQNQGLSRNADNNLVIKDVEKSTITCTEVNMSRSSEDMDGTVNIYKFTTDINGKTGFAIATGDKRIAQVIAYVENGAISDTLDIPPMAFMLRSIPTALNRELREYYEGEPSLSRNDQNWEALTTSPFVKTTWGTGSPYNNNYDMVNCSSTLNYKYQTSTTAIACAQAIISNKQRPTNFQYEICIPTWIREPKIDEKYNVYASQAAEFIKNIDSGAAVTYSCERPSVTQLLNVASSINYYGYTRDRHYSYDTSADYAKIARNAKAGYCTLFGGKISTSLVNNYYAWIVDGFQGKVNSDVSQAKMARVHCVYGFVGKGDGWFSNPFDKGSTNGIGTPNTQYQYIFFNAF